MNISLILVFFWNCVSSDSESKLESKLTWNSGKTSMPQTEGIDGALLCQLQPQHTFSISSEAFWDFNQKKVREKTICFNLLRCLVGQEKIPIIFCNFPHIDPEDDHTQHIYWLHKISLWQDKFHSYLLYSLLTFPPWSKFLKHWAQTVVSWNSDFCENMILFLRLLLATTDWGLFLLLQSCCKKTPRTS